MKNIYFQLNPIQFCDSEQYFFFLLCSVISSFENGWLYWGRCYIFLVCISVSLCKQGRNRGGGTCLENVKGPPANGEELFLLPVGNTLRYWGNFTLRVILYGEGNHTITPPPFSHLPILMLRCRLIGYHNKNRKIYELLCPSSSPPTIQTLQQNTEWTLYKTYSIGSENFFSLSIVRYCTFSKY